MIGRTFALVATAGLAASLAIGCGDENGSENPRVETILALDGDATAGSTEYASRCGNDLCHGMDGVSGPAPNMTVTVPERSDASLVTIMLEGIGSMAALDVTDREAADILAYLRQTFP